MHNEKEIIMRVLAGDVDEFRILVEKYHNLVFSICLNIAGDWFEAENLTQDTFMKVYKSLSKYEYRGFKTWICRIATNTCLDYRRNTVRNRETIMSPDDLPEKSTEIETSMEEAILLKEEAETIRGLCKTLPDIYKEALSEYYTNSKSVRQIAMESELNPKTIETRLYRAIKMLRQKWKEMEK